MVGVLYPISVVTHSFLTLTKYGVRKHVYLKLRKKFFHRENNKTVQKKDNNIDDLFIGRKKKENADEAKR